LRGFDRLAAAGFTAEDIANIRSQFHSQSSRDFLDQDFTNDEDCKYLTVLRPRHHLADKAKKKSMNTPVL
jgi:carboxylesterase type B